LPAEAVELFARAERAFNRLFGKFGLRIPAAQFGSMALSSAFTLAGASDVVC